MIDAESTDVFISHSTKDSGFTKKLRYRLIEALDDKGIQIFTSDEIRNGLPWRREIDRALDAASVVVLVVSPNSMSSAYTTYEWSYSIYRHAKHPYLVYYEQCDENHGMFSRLSDYQIPFGCCLRGDEASDCLETVIADLVQLAGEIPTLKGALSTLNNSDLNEHERSRAAVELGKVSHYLKATAFNYLLKGLQDQITGSGRNGVVAEAITNALASLGDKRAVPHLWRLKQVASGYRPFDDAFKAAVSGLSAAD